MHSILPHRSDYLSAISCTGPIYDVLCQRILNFIATCHSSDSELNRFVIKHAVYYARAQSPLGRNYALCYKRYGFKGDMQRYITKFMKSSF